MTTAGDLEADGVGAALGVEAMKVMNPRPLLVESHEEVPREFLTRMK
jgi:hypothetical protein